MLDFQTSEIVCLWPQKTHASNMAKTAAIEKRLMTKPKMELVKKFRFTAKFWAQVEQYAIDEGITPTAATREALRRLVGRKGANHAR